MGDSRPGSYDIVTFDCYGTLIDWETGIWNGFCAAAPGGMQLDRELLLDAFAHVEAAVEAGPYRTYREVLGETAGIVAARHGWPLPLSDARFLADSLPHWLPFPDTNRALERLAAAGYRLGILSNVDDDLLAATRRHLTVPFELVVTAEQVRSYKPAPGHFEAAQAAIGDAPWLHAAASYFHDIAPARAFGIATAWVNRTQATSPDEGSPDRMVHDLAALAEWLAPAAPRQA
jgi:2-haloacid dehalogenase/putative hydrolase of the HAD superfamily